MADSGVPRLYVYVRRAAEMLPIPVSDCAVIEPADSVHDTVTAETAVLPVSTVPTEFEIVALGATYSVASTSAFNTSSTDVYG